MKSKEKGLDGFVMPPCWVSGKAAFRTLPLQTPDYTFQHGDLAAHNIMIDAATLKVKALIDWEYAGFFPVGMEMWPGALDKISYRKRNQNTAPAIAEFLAEEYLECYDNWSNKKKMADLVAKGEIPDPAPLRKKLGSRS